LLDKRPELAEQLTQMIAQRRLHQQAFMEQLPATQQAIEVQNFAIQLLDRMRRFFGLLRTTVASSDEPKVR
jgi:hypothetical protein